MAAGGGAFRSLPGGLTEMVRALVAALPSRSVCLNTAVTRVVSHPALRSITPPTRLTKRFESRQRQEILWRPARSSSPLRHSSRRASWGRWTRSSRACAIRSLMRQRQRSCWHFHGSAVNHSLHGSGFVVPRVEGGGILAGFMAFVEVAGSCARRAACCCAPLSGARAILVRSTPRTQELIARIDAFADAAPGHQSGGRCCPAFIAGNVPTPSTRSAISSAWPPSNARSPVILDCM